MQIKRDCIHKGIGRFETALSKRIDGVLTPLNEWRKELTVSLYSDDEGTRRSEHGPGPSAPDPPEECDQRVAIKVQGLTKVFGGNQEEALELVGKNASKDGILKATGAVVALRNIDLEIIQGEVFVIMGLSGCGKSTLERCLNRLVRPSRGKVIVNGTDITSLDEEGLRHFRRHHISMVFQNFGLLPHRTVLENVAYGLEIQGVGREERLARSRSALELVGLKGYQGAKPSTLSGGMKQRVGLARALATDPEILLMDEAFSALDPLIRKNMQEELLDLQRKVRKTIVFVTHDLDEALRLGDRIAIMRDGGIVQVGTPEQILTSPADEYVSRFIDGVDRSKIMTCESVMKQPEAVFSLKTGPRTALKMLEDTGHTSGFVVDKDHGFVGLVRSEDLLRIIATDASIKPAISEARSVRPATKVEDLIPILVETDYPIPVLNDTNWLVGVIYPASVMRRIRSGGEQA